MRTGLDYLVIHSTGTAKDQQFSKSDLIHHHTGSPNQGGRGWNRPGFADLITIDGELVNILPEGTEDFCDLFGISHGETGLKGNIRHIAYVGGLSEDGAEKEDTRTKRQKDTLKVYCRYFIKRYPALIILGVNEAPTMQGQHDPGFEVSKWLRSLGVEEHNIFIKFNPEESEELTTT